MAHEVAKPRRCWKCHKPHTLSSKMCRSCQREAEREKQEEASRLQKLVEKGLLPKNWRQNVTRPIRHASQVNIVEAINQ